MGLESFAAQAQAVRKTHSGSDRTRMLQVFLCAAAVPRWLFEWRRARAPARRLQRNKAEHLLRMAVVVARVCLKNCSFRPSGHTTGWKWGWFLRVKPESVVRSSAAAPQTVKPFQTTAEVCRFLVAAERLTERLRTASKRPPTMARTHHETPKLQRC